MFCNCIRIFVIMVSCGSWVLSYFKLFLDVHISYMVFVHISSMIIVLVWLLVCYFWSSSCLRLVWGCVVVVCIVVLLVCCKKVGSKSIFFFILLYSVKRCMSSSTLWQWSHYSVKPVLSLLILYTGLFILVALCKFE